jgi:hypothetical protein
VDSERINGLCGVGRPVLLCEVPEAHPRPQSALRPLQQACACVKVRSPLIWIVVILAQDTDGLMLSFGSQRMAMTWEKPASWEAELSGWLHRAAAQ